MHKSGRDLASAFYLTTKPHYSLHLLTFCLVVMEAAEEWSEGLVGTVNENPPHSRICVLLALVSILLLSFIYSASVSYMELANETVLHLSYGKHLG